MVTKSCLVICKVCICAYLEVCRVFQGHWNEQKIWSFRCHGRGIMRYPIVLYLTERTKSSQDNAGRFCGKIPGPFFFLFVNQFSVPLTNEFYIFPLFFFFFFLPGWPFIIVHYETSNLCGVNSDRGTSSFLVLWGL